MDSELEARIDVLKYVNKETQRITEKPKQEFCKYLAICPGKDPDCFDPYKTEGCHTYRDFERSKILGF